MIIKYNFLKFNKFINRIRREQFEPDSIKPNYK